MNKSGSKIIACITIPMVIAPISKVSLFKPCHGRYITVKICNDLSDVIITPLLPFICILMIIIKITDKSLFKVHGNSLSEQLPDKIPFVVIGFLLQNTILSMIYMTKFMVNQAIH